MTLDGGQLRPEVIGLVDSLRAATMFDQTLTTSRDGQAGAYAPQKLERKLNIHFERALDVFAGQAAGDAARQEPW